VNLSEGDGMSDKTKIGIIICDRYRTCAGGKCLRSMKNKEGAFSIYKGSEIELVGYTTCNGCPGGNIEYTGEEMVKNGAQVIHLATGMLVGYPPCPYINTFKAFLEERYGVEVVLGTHPVPKKYFKMHSHLGTWNNPEWKPLLEQVLTIPEIREKYD
jgi:predicted metal-binding protein